MRSASCRRTFASGHDAIAALKRSSAEPRNVQATVRTLQHHSYDVEDTASVVLEFIYHPDVSYF